MERNRLRSEFEEPRFELPVENELLMLKLKAEFGAECTAGEEDIPPLVVNEFLRSVYEFEQKFREPRNRVRIYDKIGKPAFRPEQDLDARQLARELRRLMQAMNSRKLELDILGQYDDRIIYKFITEEFFSHEMDDLEMPGYVHHFCYEEFHPNHAMDIRSRTVEMITQWFDRKVNDYSWQLGDPFIHPDTRVFPRDKVLRKVGAFFEQWVRFSGGTYDIRQIGFEWNDGRGCGKGKADGVLQYDAVSADNRVTTFKGPFTFYFSNENEWWDIFYFVMPGFSWNE